MGWREGKKQKFGEMDREREKYRWKYGNKKKGREWQKSGKKKGESENECKKERREREKDMGWDGEMRLRRNGKMERNRMEKYRWK